MTNLRRRAITVFCAELGCENSLTVGPDCYVPEDWICPHCEDARREQWVQEHFKQLRQTEPPNKEPVTHES